MSENKLVRVRVKFKDDDKPNIVSVTKQQFHNLSDLSIVEECTIINPTSKPITKTKSQEKALVIDDDSAHSQIEGISTFYSNYTSRNIQTE